MREVLIGDLAYVQLATVLQIMENEQLSGWVQTRVGSVVLRNGMVVDVDVDSMPVPDGMMRLIDQETGGFIVEAGSPPKLPPISTVPALLMQAARLKDEWHRVRSHVLVPKEALSGVFEGHDALFDGTKTVADIVQELGLHPSQVVDVINDGMRDRILGHASTARPAPASNSPAPDLVHASDKDR